MKSNDDELRVESYRYDLKSCVLSAASEELRVIVMSYVLRARHDSHPCEVT